MTINILLSFGGKTLHVIMIGTDIMKHPEWLIIINYYNLSFIDFLFTPNTFYKAIP